MSVNNTSNVSSADLYNTYGTTANKKAEKSTDTAVKEEAGVVYEASGKAAKRVKNPALVAQMQADMENRQAQLQSIVSEMLGKQANTNSIGTGIWKLFAQGKYENVDQAAVEQAKKDIAEDGYWGVKQTSDRLIDFAVALAGDDDTALNKMKNAFKKGYEKAEKLWGGELPEICRNTYDTVLSKFDDLLNQSEQ